MALPYRSAVFPGISDDLASPTIAALTTTIHSCRTTSNLGRCGLSIGGTILVTLPFLLRLGNLARMNEWRRLSVLCPTFGIVVTSAVLLFVRRRVILPTRACLVGLNAAYLANAALCLVVYGPMPGAARSRSGWIVTMVIAWPMLLELVWTFVRSLRTPAIAQ